MVLIMRVLPLLLMPNSLSRFYDLISRLDLTTKRHPRLTMDDTPARSAHKKRHNVFGRLKNVLTGQNKDKDTPLATPSSCTLELTTTLGAKTGPANPKVDTFKTDDCDASDHWKTAYNALSGSDQNTLATLLPAMTTETQDAGRARTREILDQVVQATEDHYHRTVPKWYENSEGRM
ncbi:hypothetical protein BJX65DRAFT_280930 [Aspergillus insuetus]